MVAWITGGGIVYFVLLVTLGILSIRKGHWAMFLVGLFLPILWLTGVRGALQLLSLQVITVNRRHRRALARASLYGRADAPHRRAPRRKRRAPAPDAPSAARSRRRADAIGPASLRAGPPARPAPRAARSAARSRRSSGPDSASHAARRDHHSERRDQPKLTVCTGGKSHPQTASPRSQQGPHTDASQVSQAAKEKHPAWSGSPSPSQRPAADHASNPHRRRSHIRTEVRDLTPLPLRYFAAVPGPEPLGSGFRIIASELRWSYEDSNPRPLACHPAATRPPAGLCAGHRPPTSAPVRPRPGLLRYFPAVSPPYRPIEPATPPSRRVTSQNLPRCYRQRFLHNQASGKTHERHNPTRPEAAAWPLPTVASPRIPLSHIQATRRRRRR
jgi:hypothetical protein